MADDINIVLSGGTQNTDQRDSLGGFPSPVPPGDGKNNLFNNVTPRQTTQGWVDYRCLYVFNDSEDARYSVNTYIVYLNEVGATVQLGVLLQNEVQSLNFNTIPTGGSFTISVQGLKSDTITWDGDPGVLAERIEEAISAVTDCSVTVPTAGTHVYHIEFQGILGNKALSTMSVTDNVLLPSPISPITARVTYGSPINTVAPDIGDEKIAPTGIAFSTPLAPGLHIGKLSPSEGFPVWVKRIVTPGFEAVEDDGFELKVEVSSDE